MVGLGVIMHMTMDKLIIDQSVADSIRSAASVIPIYGETAKDVVSDGITGGTYMLYIVIGVAAVAYLFISLFKEYQSTDDRAGYHRGDNRARDDF